MRSLHSWSFYTFVLATVLTVLLMLSGPYAVRDFSSDDIAFYLLLGGHFFLIAWWGYFFLKRKDNISIRFFIECLFFLGLLLLLFAYFYAKNANLDYVKRFTLARGLHFDSDITEQRITVLVRYLPLLVASGCGYILLLSATCIIHWVRRYAALFVLLGAVLSAAAFPSPFFHNGVGLFSWIAFVPLFFILRFVSLPRAIFLGVLHGVFVTLLAHYWLATFSLVSLQAAVGVISLYYIISLPLLLVIIYRVRGVLVPALLWTLFAYMQHQGFAAFPWVTPGYSQFRMIPLIQISSFTGVWGVNFLIFYVNMGIAEFFYHSYFAKEKTSKKPWHLLVWPSIAILTVVCYGEILLLQEPPYRKNVKLLLVQNNSDPRKAAYEETLQRLATLTNKGLNSQPELVIWPETAFVPNIRRWGKEDPQKYPLARLVRMFKQYQTTIGTWLLTGNDDYELVLDSKGDEKERREYNAAVLFDPTGKRIDTYRKIKLVPFTETFPYKDIFPGIYQVLLNFDVHFWQAGSRWVVFQHPQFSFSVLICFEDSFPPNAARMVREGAEILVNISNDYWAQDKIEAIQHFTVSVFRAVENRRPLVRSTVSGMTGYIDAYGRIQADAPLYEQAYLPVDVLLTHNRLTTYTKYGDWFIYLSGIIVLIVGIKSLFRQYYRK